MDFAWAPKPTFKLAFSWYYIYPVVIPFSFVFKNVPQRCLYHQKVRTSQNLEWMCFACTLLGCPKLRHQALIIDVNEYFFSIMTHKQKESGKPLCSESRGYLDDPAFCISPFLPLWVARMNMCHLELYQQSYDHEVTSLKTKTKDHRKGRIKRTSVLYRES